MTVQELAEKIIDIAQKALEQEKHMVIYIGDTCDAKVGLEDIIKLCQDVRVPQEAFRQYEKKKVSHESTKN
jgi:hypothetical protein